MEYGSAGASPSRARALPSRWGQRPSEEAFPSRAGAPALPGKGLALSGESFFQHTVSVIFPLGRTESFRKGKAPAWEGEAPAEPQKPPKSSGRSPIIELPITHEKSSHRAQTPNPRCALHRRSTAHHLRYRLHKGSRTVANRQRNPRAFARGLARCSNVAYGAVRHHAGPYPFFCGRYGKPHRI